jgi:phosphohistidine swiveling domain-containing protein
MIFNKEEWAHLGQWVQPTLSGCFWEDWTQNNEKFPFEIPKLPGRVIILDGHSFIKKEDYQVLEQFILDNENDFENIKVLENWVDAIHLKCKERINREFPNLVDYIKNMKELMNDLVNPWVFFLLLEKPLTERIKEICQENEFNYKEIAGSILPSRKPFMIKQIEEAQTLYQKIANLKIKELNLKFFEENYPDLTTEIKEHVKRFEFCGIHHFVGEPYSIEKFFQDFRLVEKDEPEKTTIPQELNWHIQLMSLTAFARTHMAETSGYVQHQIRPKLLEADHVLGLNAGEHVWLTADELIAALESPESFQKSVEERKEKVGSFIENGKEIVVSGKEVDQLLDQLLEKEEVNFPLTGTVASKGLVTGPAKLVIKPEDVHKVNAGDILVAPETTPDFISGMKKAAGIITCRGGITSHAAIVSREFKIPCVVGVNGATTAIKDNDLIELDAEKGIIKKIN